MSIDAAQELEQVAKRLSACEGEIGRMEGRQQQALQELQRVEEECKGLGVAPDGLAAAIQEAQQQEQKALQAFEQGVAALEASLAQAQQAFDGGVNNE